MKKTIPHSRGKENGPVEKEPARRRSHEELEERVRERTAALEKAAQDLRAEIARRRETEKVLRESEERLRASEEAVKESEAKFRALVERIPAIIYTSASDDLATTLYVSPRIESLLGYSGEEWIRDPALWTRSIHPEDREHVLKERERSRRTDEEFAQEYRMLARDGRVVWVRDKAEKSRTEAGKPPIRHGVLIDITRIKEMEHLALAQEKMASLGQLAAGMAHEIRNPLSGINLHLAAVEKFVEEAEGLDPKAKDAARGAIGTAKAASEKIEDVIQKVMRFARPGALRLSPVRIDQAIREAVDLSAVALKRSGITLDVAVPEELPECRADLRLIGQVLIHLITNAAQALEGQQNPRRILIGARTDGGHIVLTVADSGPGVPKESRRRIFDPFYTTKSGGVGTGLSFSSRVIADHGGSIDVGGSALGGAEFRIRIPVR